MPKYPFDPAHLDAYPEPLAELAREYELQALKEIADRIKIAGQMNEVTVQMIRTLRARGIDLKDIKKAIQEWAGISEKDLNKMLDDVIERNQKYYAEVIDLAKITKPAYLVDERDIEAIRRQTLDTFRNITQSMGFSVKGRATLLPVAKAYQWALDKALTQVESGGISYNQAIDNALRELADGGLCVAKDKDGNILKNRVKYESGHIDHLDVAIRRAVMTGVNQVNQRYREQSMEYLETDLVEVTAHLGARNIDGPKGWENHAKWQGKVYRIKDKPHTSKGQYDYLENVCGYGDVQGIGGANCRHSFHPFIEGVMERTYTDKELEAMKPENKPKIVFEGREYDDYQATQKQRQIEREIRKWKRRKAVADGDEKAAAGARIKRLNAKYKVFSAAAGLPEQRERMIA